MTTQFKSIEDVLIIIFKNLLNDKKSLINCAITCKFWHSLVIPIIWHKLKFDTKIPALKNLRNENLKNIENLREVDMFDMICEENDFNKLKVVDNLFKLDENSIDFIRILHLNFNFNLEIELSSLNFIDEEDLSSALKDKCWDEFIARSEILLNLLNRSKNLIKLKIFIDVEINQRTSIQQLKFYHILKSILEYPLNYLKKKNYKNFFISLSFGKKTDISGDLNYFWDAFNLAGSFIKKFKVKGHSGLWLSSRIKNLLHMIGPLNSLHLNDGARLIPEILQILSNKHFESLKTFHIVSPDFVDDEELFKGLLSKSKNLKKLTLDGSISTWSRISSGGFYSNFEGTNLTYLNISRCSKLPPNFYDQVINTCRKLKTFKALSSNLKTENAASILNSLQNLEYLDFGFCEIDFNFFFLIKSHKNLRELNLVGCKKIFLEKKKQNDSLLQPGCLNLANFILDSINFKFLRVGPVRDINDNGLGWSLFGNIENAILETEKNNFWSGSLKCERYFIINGKSLSKMKTLLKKNEDNIEKAGLLPYVKLLSSKL
ncbi:hypothetical protein HDU92_000390 [Lobulomyces angularis]|nr:hypothetical protein HDU92_000390 [Lobulomyces angularis]